PVAEVTSSVAAPLAPRVPTARTSTAAQSEAPPRVDSAAGSASTTPIAPPSPEDSLAREAALLEQARSALAHDPASAFHFLDEHLAQFPRGQLAGEREFIAVNALLRMKRTDEARARAQALIAKSPSSPYAARLRQLVETP